MNNNFNSFGRMNGNMARNSMPMANGNNIMQMLMGGMNPNSIMQNIIRQNPQAQVILNQMQQSGMTPQQYVMQLARQNNVDLSPMLNMLKQRGFKL